MVYHGTMKHGTTQNASDVIETTSAAVLEVLGTKVTVDTPLMSAGLDSIAVTDLVNVLSKRFEIELPPTLFDHPTIGSVFLYYHNITDVSESPWSKREKLL